MSISGESRLVAIEIPRRYLRDFIDPLTNSLHPDAKQHVFESARGQITSCGARHYKPKATNGPYLQVSPIKSSPTRPKNTDIELLLNQQLPDPIAYKS